MFGRPGLGSWSPFYSSGSSPLATIPLSPTRSLRPLPVGRSFALGGEGGMVSCAIHTHAHAQASCRT